MKRLMQLVCMLCISTLYSYGQVKIGDNPVTINANSLLELESTNKGAVNPSNNAYFAGLTQPVGGHGTHRVACGHSRAYHKLQVNNHDGLRYDYRCIKPNKHQLETNQQVPKQETLPSFKLL